MANYQNNMRYSRQGNMRQTRPMPGMHTGCQNPAPQMDTCCGDSEPMPKMNHMQRGTADAVVLQETPERQNAENGRLPKDAAAGEKIPFMACLLPWPMFPGRPGVIYSIYVKASRLEPSLKNWINRLLGEEAGDNEKLYLPGRFI